MSQPQKPTYVVLSAVEDGPLIRIGALWPAKNGSGFSGKLDCIPMHPRIVVMPVDSDNPPPTAPRPIGKAPVYRLYGVASAKAPLIAIGSLWHTADARGYQGVLDATPLNGRLLMFENTSSPREGDSLDDIDWDDPTPF